MASKKKKASAEATDGKKKKIMIAGGVVGVIVLLIVGFILGIYLGLFDQEEMNEKYGIYDWPIIGESFVRPLSEEELAAQEAERIAQEAEAKRKADEEAKSKPVKLTKEEIDKQTQERQAAEKKRIGKLSRLYNEMKADDAAKILTGLDDDMSIAIMQKMDESQVSQILASEEFGAEHAAEITRKMYRGMPKRVNNPSDEE